jgi:acetaldehyde dehydrogenase (acetylating)
VYIERSADVPFAVEQILLSKTFDNGTVCASEQALVVERCLAEAVREEFERRRGYFLSEEEVGRLEAVAFSRERGLMNPEIVGQPAAFIAAKAQLAAPPEVELLIAPLKGVGDKHPLSAEILAPILAFYVVDDFE